MAPRPDPQEPVLGVALCQSSHSCPSECPSPAGLVGGGASEPQARKALGVSAGAAMPYREGKAGAFEATGAPWAGPAPSSPVCVLPDSAVVLEEGSPSEAASLAEPRELEDFEATLGTDRHCRHAEAYSRVSAAGPRSRRPVGPYGCSPSRPSGPGSPSDLSLSHWVWEGGSG